VRDPGVVLEATVSLRRLPEGVAEGVFVGVDMAAGAQDLLVAHFTDGLTSCRSAIVDLPGSAVVRARLVRLTRGGPAVAATIPAIGT
jgi:hypothetical protein